MQLFCPCLNVSLAVKPLLSLPEVKPLDALSPTLLVGGSLAALLDGLSEEERSDHFFQDPHVHLLKFHSDECRVDQQIPFLSAQRQVDRWLISQCLICSRVTHATTESIGGSPTLLIRVTNLLKDEPMIQRMRSSPGYSPTFQVVLPEMTGAVVPSDDSYHSKKICQAIQSQCGRFLQEQQEAMEDRIKAFQEAEQNKFESLKQRLKADKQSVLKLITQKAFDLKVSCEEENDSAVPLSPLSMTSGVSGDMSPGIFSFGKGGTNVVQHQMEPNFSLPQNDQLDDAKTFRRPKAHSNPTSLTTWKRRRHLAGPPRPRAVSEQWEEEETVFSFDEQVDVSSWIDHQPEPVAPHSPLAAAPVDSEVLDVFSGGDTIFGGGRQFGTSLPVNVSRVGCVGGESRFMDDSISEEEEEEVKKTGRRRQSTVCEKAELNGKASVCAESFEVLAKSLRRPDDRDRLFGEIPHRRRYQTGGDVTKARELRMLAE